MSGWLHDLRFALRQMVRRPGFTALAVATLSLGFGANVAIFSLVREVLLAPPPFPDPARLVRVHELAASGGTMAASWPTFSDWRQRAEGFEGLAAWATFSGTVLGGDRPRRLSVALVSQDFFSVLAVPAAVGRWPIEEEHRAGAEPVAVVVYSFWRDELGGGPIEESVLEVGGLSGRVVGVMPPGFSFPEGVQLWAPLELDQPAPSRTAHNYQVIGRLAPGVAVPGMRRQLATLTAQVLAEEGEAAGDPDYLPVGVAVVTLQEERAAPMRRPLLLLLGAAGLVLLVACSNLASAQLARGVERQGELAVRSALGAGRRRLVRQLLVEGVVLASVGAAAGIALALATGRLLAASAPAGLPLAEALTLDPQLFLFAAGVAVASGLLSTLVPALAASGGDRTVLLRGASSGGVRGRGRLGRLLVMAEVAMVTVLLVGAALLLRSFWQVLSVAPGFEPRGVLTAELHLPDSRYPGNPERAAFLQELLTALEALPGVESAGAVSHLPLAGANVSGRVDVEGGPLAVGDASYRVATSGYFTALGIPLLRGRLFDGRDHADSPHVVVVNRALAEAFWPGDDPLGKRITGGGLDDFWEQDRWATVVGVVGNVRHRDLARAPEPELFFPIAQRPFRARSSVVAVQAAGSIEALAPVVQQTLVRVGPEVAFTMSTLEEIVARSTGQRRFALSAVSAFAAVALLLAAMGVYGVVAHSVARRRRELGVRMALGADPRAVRRGVVASSLLTVLPGLVLGVAAGLALGRLLSTLLYGVAPGDPLSFAVAVAVLLAAAGVASWLPARRILAIDPLEALKSP